ncbi:hypothetical protein GCM10008924_28370 [Gracilibacillus halotolerans]
MCFSRVQNKHNGTAKSVHKKTEKSSKDDDAEREYMFENTRPEVLRAYTEAFFNEVKIYK